MTVKKVKFEQLAVHPEIISTINVDAMIWLFENGLVGDVLIDHLDLKPIPVVLKKGSRKKTVYQVIGSVNEYLALIEVMNFRPEIGVPVHILESFSLKKSLNSCAYDTWGRKSGRAANAVSAALFLQQGNVRAQSQLPVMHSEHITTGTDSKAGRIKRITGFDNRGNTTKKSLSRLPDNVRNFVFSLLGMNFTTANDGTDDDKL